MTLEDLTNFVKANRDKGRGVAFGWSDDELQIYIRWADVFQYLFVESNESGFTGIAVMYPVEKHTEQNANNLMTFGNIIPISEENSSDLCVMDFIATSTEAKKNLVIQLKERYPNWQNQNKWALRFGNIKKLSNNYINLLTI